MPKKTTSIDSCIACDGDTYSKYSDELVACKDCNLVVAKDIPTFNELKELYKKDYFFGMEYSDYKADRKALEANFNQRLKFLNDYLHNKARVVEVGCAYGYFLNLIKDKVDWHKGFDVSPDGIEYAKNKLGVNATTKDFLDDNEIKPNTINLVCMWDVMEHFGEPHKHVEKAAKILKKGGALSLTTGNMSSFVPRVRKDKWRMVHPPTHIYYFDDKNIEKLLAKYGLKVTSVRHKATYRNAGSVFNQLICNKKAKQKKPYVLEAGYKIAKTVRADKLNIPLNLYDVMEVTAIKI